MSQLACVQSGAQLGSANQLKQNSTGRGSSEEGFKRFDNAVVTISGIELAEKIKTGQFKTGKLGGCDATMTELWNAALAA